MNASRRLASIGSAIDIVAVDADVPDWSAAGSRRATRSVVVLPAPLGPMSPTISPADDLKREVVDRR